MLLQLRVKLLPLHYLGQAPTRTTLAVVVSQQCPPHQRVTQEHHFFYSPTLTGATYILV